MHTECNTVGYYKHKLLSVDPTVNRQPTVFWTDGSPETGALFDDPGSRLFLSSQHWKWCNAVASSVSPCCAEYFSVCLSGWTSFCMEWRLSISTLSTSVCTALWPACSCTLVNTACLMTHTWPSSQHSSLLHTLSTPKQWVHDLHTQESIMTWQFDLAVVPSSKGTWMHLTWLRGNFHI